MIDISSLPPRGNLHYLVVWYVYSPLKLEILMNNSDLEVSGYEVSTWLEETGWPTHESDILEMVTIYHEWESSSPRCRLTGTLDEDELIKATIDRMKTIHPDHRDALVISSMLLVQAAFMAKRQGLSTKRYRTQ